MDGLEKRVARLEQVLAAAGLVSEDWAAVAQNLLLRDVDGNVRVMLGPASDGASKLVLKDAGGTVRAMLDVHPIGSSLMLLDSAGKQRAALMLVETGPMLQLSHANEEVRTLLHVDDEGSSTLALFDATKDMRLMLTVRANDGAPSIHLLDKEKKPRARLNVSEDGVLNFILLGRTGKMGVGLGTAPDGSAWLQFYDANRQPRVSIDTGADGLPFLTLLGADGKVHAMLGVEGASPCFTLRDASGKVIWTAPEE